MPASRPDHASPSMLEVTEIIARRASAHDDVLRQTQPWQDYIDQKARERRGKRRSTDALAENVRLRAEISPQRARTAAATAATWPTAAEPEQHPQAASGVGRRSSGSGGGAGSSGDAARDFREPATSSHSRATGRAAAAVASRRVAAGASGSRHAAADAWRGQPERAQGHAAPRALPPLPAAPPPPAGRWPQQPEHRRTFEARAAGEPAASGGLAARVNGGAAGLARQWPSCRHPASECNPGLRAIPPPHPTPFPRPVRFPGARRASTSPAAATSFPAALASKRPPPPTPRPLESMSLRPPLAGLRAPAQEAAVQAPSRARARPPRPLRSPPAPRWPSPTSPPSPPSPLSPAARSFLPPLVAPHRNPLFGPWLDADADAVADAVAEAFTDADAVGRCPPTMPLQRWGSGLLFSCEAEAEEGEEEEEGFDARRPLRRFGGERRVSHSGLLFR